MTYTPEGLHHNNNNMVTNKRHMMDFKNPFCSARFSVNFRFFFKTTFPQHSDPFQKCLVLFFHILIISSLIFITVYVVFCFGSNPEIYSSLCRALISQINLGIHPERTRQKLMYFFYFTNKHHIAWIYILKF